VAGRPTRRSVLVSHPADPVERTRVRVRRHLDRLQPVGQASGRPREPGRLPQGRPHGLLRLRHRHRGRRGHLERVGDEGPADHQDHVLLGGEPRRMGSSLGPQGRLQAGVSEILEEVSTKSASLLKKASQSEAVLKEVFLALGHRYRGPIRVEILFKLFSSVHCQFHMIRCS